jgi:hypothetical protein
MIFCAACDPGGSRAMLPVIMELEQRKTPYRVLNHGFLGDELPSTLRYALCSQEESLQLVGQSSVFFFSSSVSDTLPLSLARRARRAGIPVVHLLDNWSAYASRLGTDGLPPLMPDVYAVMDEAAWKGAAAEGIPEETLMVVGHPGLAELAALRPTRVDRQEAAKHLGLPTDRLLLAFLDEAFAEAIGRDEHSPGHPGFTEDTVLPAFAAALAPFADRVYVAVLPHPRGNLANITALWKKSRQGLSGEILTLSQGRHILPAVSGIAGMASILLYEAWLVGLPVLSMQPGCQWNSLRRFAFLDGIAYADTRERIPAAVATWVAHCGEQSLPHLRPELTLHAAASKNIADMLVQFLSRPTTHARIRR